MKFKVRYFAIFRESTGKGSETVDSNALSAADLFAEMTSRYPGLTGFEAALVAINDEMAAWDSPLNDGDEVLFFPPVAGG